MRIMSCPHNPWPIPAPRHSHAPTPFPIHNSKFSHILHSPTHNSHLKHNSSCMLLCSNSDPAPTYYVIPFCIITLASPLSLTLHPCSHQHCCALFSSMKSHLHVCIWHVQISTCVTIVYSTYQLLVTLVLTPTSKLYLCARLYAHLPQALQTLDLTPNTKHHCTMKLTGPWTLTLSPHKILGPW